ncbi:MAG: hypothetical protein P8Z37_10645 [Acidobacteriota bacterium]
MDTTDRPSSELNALWKKLDELKSLESDSSGRIPRASNIRTIEQIRAEIETGLGYFPPHFAPALETPGLLESLWHQHLTSYSENPLPELFKEKLSVRLSRYCRLPYFTVLHACTLIQMGISSGQVRKLIEGELESVPTSPELSHHFLPENIESCGVWPHVNTSFEY